MAEASSLSIVRGDLIVDEAVIGDYNDGSAQIQGSMVAKLFVPFDHYFEVLGESQVDECLEELSFDERPKQLDQRFYIQNSDSYSFSGEDVMVELRAGRSILTS